PFQLATCAYYTGIDPISGKEVYVPKGLRERRLQHALLLYYNPTFYHDVKSALKEAGREDLIGNDERSLIPPYPSKDEALRRSSRVKRYIRQNEREAREKEEFRSRYIDPEEDNQKHGKRVGRERSQSNGGYRSGAREFGARSRYADSKVWDPVEKRWKRSSVPDVSNNQDDKKDSRHGGEKTFGQSEDKRLNSPNNRRFSDKKRFGRERSDRTFGKIENRANGDENDSFRRRNEAEGESFQKGRFEDRRFDDNREKRFDNKYPGRRSDANGQEPGDVFPKSRNGVNAKGSLKKSGNLGKGGRPNSKGSSKFGGGKSRGGFKRRPK
ncbi:MAG: DUF3362 domain-containing protein, partial [Thermoguttaceae bacterium]|nr:DUF3362 domain-containing protein [Thermoguttaceae bacterium]